MRGCVPRSATSRSTGRPGSKLQYHAQAAHLVQAMVIEAVTGQDYRDVIRDAGDRAAGLGNDIFVGVPEAQQIRCADTYAPEPRDNSAEFRAAGLPSGGGFATARGMAAFYQMLGAGGRLGECAAVLAAADRLRLAQPYRRAGRRADGWDSDASRAGAARARRERPYPRPGHDRRAGDVRAWRRRVVVFLGRSEQWRVVQLFDEFRVARSVAFGAAGSRGEPGARGDRLSGRVRPPLLGRNDRQGPPWPVTAAPVAYPCLGHGRRQAAMTGKY